MEKISHSPESPADLQWSQGVKNPRKVEEEKRGGPPEGETRAKAQRGAPGGETLVISDDEEDALEGTPRGDTKGAIQEGTPRGNTKGAVQEGTPIGDTKKYADEQQGGGPPEGETKEDWKRLGARPKSPTLGRDWVRRNKRKGKKEKSPLLRTEEEIGGEEAPKGDSSGEFRSFLPGEDQHSSGIGDPFAKSGKTGRSPSGPRVSIGIKGVDVEKSMGGGKRRRSGNESGRETTMPTREEILDNTVQMLDSVIIEMTAMITRFPTIHNEVKKAIKKQTGIIQRMRLNMRIADEKGTSRKKRVMSEDRSAPSSPVLEWDTSDLTVMVDKGVQAGGEEDDQRLDELRERVRNAQTAEEVNDVIKEDWPRAMYRRGKETTDIERIGRGDDIVIWEKRREQGGREIQEGPWKRVRDKYGDMLRGEGENTGYERVTWTIKRDNGEVKERRIHRVPLVIEESGGE